MIAYNLGSILPADTNKAELIKTDRWKVFYIYIPATMYILYFLALVFTVKHDSLKNLILKG